MDGDEALNSLQEDADAEGEKEDAVEERTQQGRALPTEGELGRRVFTLGDLRTSLQDDLTDAAIRAGLPCKQRGRRRNRLGR